MNYHQPQAWKFIRVFLSEIRNFEKEVEVSSIIRVSTNIFFFTSMKMLKFSHIQLSKSHVADRGYRSASFLHYLKLAILYYVRYESIRIHFCNNSFYPQKKLDR